MSASNQRRGGRPRSGLTTFRGSARTTRTPTTSSTSATGYQTQDKDGIEVGVVQRSRAPIDKATSGSSRSRGVRAGRRRWRLDEHPFRHRHGRRRRAAGLVNDRQTGDLPADAADLEGRRTTSTDLAGEVAGRAERDRRGGEPGRARRQGGGGYHTTAQVTGLDTALAGKGTDDQGEEAKPT